MTMITSPATAPVLSGAIYNLVTRLEHVWIDLRALPRVRATAKALNALTDRELNDLGLVRADIPRIARGLGRRNA